MDRAHIELDATGKIIVDTSRLYIDDPNAGVNQFNDPGAFHKRLIRQAIARASAAAVGKQQFWGEQHGGR